MRNIMCFILLITLSAIWIQTEERNFKITLIARDIYGTYERIISILSFYVMHEHFAFKSYYRIRDETTECTRSV